MREKTVKPGDHFRKSDAVYPSVWVVTRVIHTPGVPTHYMLADTEGRGEVRTISEPTLTDPEYYTPVVHKGESGTTDLNGGAPAGDRQEATPSNRGRANDHAMAEDRGWLDNLDALGGQTAGQGGVR